MGAVRQWRSSLLRDTGGNVLPMAAMSMVVMAALVGGGVDMSRAYKVQNRLQNACDSGVLAGRRAVTTNGFDSVAQAQANRFFTVNYDEQGQGTTSTTHLFAGDSQGNSIGGHASTQMPMLIMQLFGHGSMTVAVNCASTMGVGNSDVTMVLDVTGSMGSSLGSGTRLSALQTAMKNFYSTVATASQGRVGARGHSSRLSHMAASSRVTALPAPKRSTWWLSTTLPASPNRPNPARTAR